MPTSNYLRGKLVDGSLRGLTYIAPTNVYVSLHIADPTVNALAGSEVSGAWYTRRASTFVAQTVAGQTSNTADISYSPVTTGPVTVTHFAIWDDATLGNMLYFGQLATPKTFSNTDVPSWLAGQVTVVGT